MICVVLTAGQVALKVFRIKFTMGKEWNRSRVGEVCKGNNRFSSWERLIGCPEGASYAQHLEDIGPPQYRSVLWHRIWIWATGECLPSLIVDAQWVASGFLGQVQ